MSTKFQSLINRLGQKVNMSATPVEGFVVGLSGTDSVITFILLNEVAKELGHQFKVFGIHCVESATIESSFQKIGMMQWLRDRYPESTMAVSDMSNVGNSDQFRWAEFHHRAAQYKFWFASTMNATEKFLGTYSIMNKSASIAPIQSLYKSEIIELCKEYNVPQRLIDLSQIPDCVCGRDEFAAENIELIDNVIRNRFTDDMDIALVAKAAAYIRDAKNDNDFKNRTPYMV